MGRDVRKMGARSDRRNRALHDLVADAVKSEIAEQEVSYYRISQDTGISSAALSRFRQPGGTIKAESLIVLLNYLSIDLVANRIGEPKVIFRSKRRK